MREDAPILVRANHPREHIIESTLQICLVDEASKYWGGHQPEPAEISQLLHASLKHTLVSQFHSASREIYIAKGGTPSLFSNQRFRLSSKEGACENKFGKHAPMRGVLHHEQEPSINSAEESRPYCQAPDIKQMDAFLGMAGKPEYQLKLVVEYNKIEEYPMAQGNYTSAPTSNQDARASTGQSGTHVSWDGPGMGEYQERERAQAVEQLMMHGLAASLSNQRPQQRHGHRPMPESATPGNATLGRACWALDSLNAQALLPP